MAVASFLYGPGNPAPQSTFTGARLLPAQPSASVISRPSTGVLGAATTSLSGGGNTGGNMAPVVNDQSSAAQQAVAAQLAQLNSAYDYNAAQLNNQLSGLGSQKANALSSLDTELQGVQKQVGSSKKNAQDATDSNIQDALSTAQEAQRSSRNTLRALGILNSSAAGELLQKPLNQYDQQRARLSQALTQRMGELDDFLNQKTAEHSNAVSQIQQQYANLVGQIQTDLRFNDRQRADAIQAANAALVQRLADIKQAQFNYESQVNAMKQDYAQGLQQLSTYQPQTADLNSILSSAYTAPQASNPQTVGLTLDDQLKKNQGLSFYGQ